MLNQPLSPTITKHQLTFHHGLGLELVEGSVPKWIISLVESVRGNGQTIIVLHTIQILSQEIHCTVDHVADFS